MRAKVRCKAGWDEARLPGVGGEVAGAIKEKSMADVDKAGVGAVHGLAVGRWLRGPAGRGMRRDFSRHPHRLPGMWHQGPGALPASPPGWADT